MAAHVSNEAKAEVWRTYFAGEPTRVPVRLNANPRVIVLDPALCPPGATFEAMAADPAMQVKVQLAFQHYLHTELHRYMDQPLGLPDVWRIGMYVGNVYEASLLGSPIAYPPGQVPSNEPAYGETDKHKVFEIDISDPLNMSPLRDWLAFWREMERICDGMTFEGRPVELQPWALTGTDGMVTAGCSLRGDGFLMDLAADPDYADRLLARVTDLAIRRRQAFFDYWGDRIPQSGAWMADDSVAMLSVAMYRKQVMPHHRRFLEAGPPGMRSFHLCGDAQRLFPVICSELGVRSIDTGFPLDHGRLRDELGPEIEILGGPEVATLLHGSPEAVYQRARRILQSGVMRGGKFVLEEGNNLPPRCPPANLEAMYQAALDFGRYA